MKKIFTLVAVAAMAISASAQTSSNGTVTFNTLVAKDAADPISSITVTDDGTLKGTYGTNNVTGSAVQATYKDLSGTSMQFGDNQGYVKFQPTAESSLASGTGDTPADYTSYVDFTVTENDLDKSFGNLIVEFDATRLGTDAVRLQAEVLSNNTERTDGGYDATSGKLLTSDNWQTYADGESWAMYASVEGGEKDSYYECGWTPIREDLSKGTNTAQSTTPWNHVTITNPTLAEGSYVVTLRIYVNGIASNKGFLIENVKFSFGDATGINEVASEAVSAKAAKKVVNGKLVIEKNGKQYNAVGAEL